MRIRRRALPAVAAAVVMPAGAQEAWPVRPVKIIVPTAAGGAVDFVARLMAQRFSERTGQSFVVENRGGSAGIVGMDAVAKAPADGYTLLFAAAPIALNTALGLPLPYDPEADFAAISLVASVPALLVVHPSTAYRTIADLIEAGRQGGVSVAVPIVGSITHLMAEVLRSKSGPNFTVVAYRGSGQAIQDMLAGNVDAFYDALIPTGQHVRSGRLRGIAVGSRERSPMFPEIATVVEQGFPELIGSGFYGMLAPARTPPAIVARVHAELVAAGQVPDIREKLLAQGLEIHTSTPQEYREFIRFEIARWTPVVQAAGIKP